MKQRRPGQGLFILSFLAPAFLLFTTFVAYPGIQAFIYSLHRWDGLTEAEWVGLRNFIQLFQDREVFYRAFLNNIFLTLVPGSMIIGLALLFAALLHRKVRGAPLFRVAFFFPNVIAAVAVALLWVLLYSVTDFGVFNGFLLFFQDTMHGWGFSWPQWELPFAFLDSSNLIYAIAPMMVWAMTGFFMVLFLAAMGGIPETYYEVARLEGATGFQQFRMITLPLIREVLSIGIIFLVILSLKYFDPIWVMENQQPSRDSHVLATLLYQKVFSEYNVGYGSAIAVLLFVLVFLATLISLRLSRGDKVEF